MPSNLHCLWDLQLLVYILKLVIRVHNYLVIVNKYKIIFSVIVCHVLMYLSAETLLYTQGLVPAHKYWLRTHGEAHTWHAGMGMLLRKGDISTPCRGADVHRDRKETVHMKGKTSADVQNRRWTCAQTTEASQVSLEPEDPDAEVVSVLWKLSSAFCLVGLPAACL